jgi:hypothetical protein
MSLKERLQQYVGGMLGSYEAVRYLPTRADGAMRLKRMTPELKAMDWRLMVEEQCKEVRRTISLGRSREILATEVEALLRLLGEIDD